jgi:ethanolamine utilization microcompartment shell protein EutL
MTEIRLQEPEWVFPLDGMEVGDSFFVPTVKPAEMLYKIDTCAKVAKVRVKAFASSKEGHLGVRVWRVG